MTTEYQQELEAEEKKHRKIIKYDMEIFVVLLVLAIVVTTINFILKGEYQSVAKAKSGVAPAIIECNKSILNMAETFRKNSTDSVERVNVDIAKISFDAAIVYYGTVMKKNMDDGDIVHVIDSCYLMAVRFHDVIQSQKSLSETGITSAMLTGLKSDIKHLKEKANLLVTGIDEYNSSGLLLKVSWMTPYPGKIEYQHAMLPDIQASN